VIDISTFKSGEFIWDFTDKPSGIYLISSSEFCQKFIVP